MPNTEHERRLAKVLYEATTGAAHPDVPWERAVQGMWLADAARILGGYQAEYAEAVRTLAASSIPPAQTTEEKPCPGAPTVMWTCDRCGKVEHVLVTSTPAGWKRVMAENLSGHALPNDYEADWCKTCAATYLAPLPQVAPSSSTPEDQAGGDRD